MQTFTYIPNLFKLICIITSCNCTIYGQNLRKIKKSDTLYIYFKKNNAKQLSIKTFKDGCHYSSYMYKLRDTTNSGVNPGFFQNCNYKSSVLKSIKFLKKKQNLIINYNFYKENEKEVVEELVKKRRPIFIIDEDEIKEKKIILREVVFIEIYNQFPIE